MKIRDLIPALTPGERVRVIPLCGGFMCVAAAALVGRTMGDTLFLSRYDAHLLSYMYVGTALVVGSAAYLIGIWSGRLPIHRLIVLASGGLTLVLLSLRAALMSPWDGFRIAAYLVGDLIVQVPMVLFWSFAALIFNPREAKRLFGFVGASGTAACILTGFLLRPFTAYFGVENLLVLLAVLIAGFAVLIARLARRAGIPLPSVAARPGRGPAGLLYYTGLLKTMQVRHLALLTLIATAAITLNDYQFKASARSHYRGAELAGFFGAFYGYSNVIILCLQMFFVHRILRAGGVVLALSILPSGLLITFSGTALSGAFGWGVATRFVGVIFDFTVQSAAMQMLYLGVKKQSRSQARTLVEGICRPVAMMAAGAGLVGGAGVLSLQHLAGVGAVLCLLWLVAVRRNGAAYLAGLMDILNTGRLDLSEEAVPFHDKSVERYMRRTLPAARTDELPYLLSLLPELKETDLAPEFRALLQRDASPLKVAAIDYLGSRGAPEDLPSIVVHLEHPDPQVRTAAVQAIPAPGGTAWTATLERCAEDPDPAVRAAAVAGLFDIGDSMGRGIAAAALQHMLASERPEMRIAAADALAHCRSEGLAQRLTDLLRDDNPAVRLAALAACRSHPDSRVIPEVIPLLTEPRTRAAAAETLVAFGPAALAHLIPYLNPERWNGAPEGRYRVPAILAKIGDPAACDALGMCLDAPDLRFRCEGIAAYCTLVSRMPLSKRVRSALHAALDRELQAAEERQQILKEMEPLSDTTLLCDALREEHRRHLRNVFTLLGTRTPGVDMDRIYRSLYSTDERRANAIEILDNVLERQVKGRLLRLIETGNAEDTPQKSGQPPSFDLLLRPAGSDWVIVGALYAAAGHRLKGYENAFHALLHHPNPVVRETALYAIGSVATPGVIRAVCGRMADDPDPGIRRFAEHLAVRQSIGGIPS